MIESLHASQRTLNHNTEYARISLDVPLSNELCLKLMGYGPYVKVIRPPSLRRNMRDRLWRESKDKGG